MSRFEGSQTDSNSEITLKILPVTDNCTCSFWSDIQYFICNLVQRTMVE